MRCPQAVLDRFDAEARRRRMTRSELLRQVIEREVLNAPPRAETPRSIRRLRRLRRCVSCSAFVRNGYTCKSCRRAGSDSVVIAGLPVPLPHLTRAPLVARPDVRDPAWLDAEAIVLDAFAPVVAIVYEFLSQSDTYEMTDLDDVADLLSMAASLTH